MQLKRAALILTFFGLSACGPQLAEDASLSTQQGVLAAVQPTGKGGGTLQNRAPVAPRTEARDELAQATTPDEQAALQAKLDKATAHKQHAKKDKKAQQQRVAKAEGRLADCQAAQAG